VLYVCKLSIIVTDTILTQPPSCHAVITEVETYIEGCLGAYFANWFLKEVVVPLDQRQKGTIKSYTRRTRTYPLWGIVLLYEGGELAQMVEDPG
jgi:hypothetical protein